LTNTALSGARLYWENWGKLGFFNAKDGVSIPVAVGFFPDELYPAPRSWAERAFPKLIHYNKVEKGGHFAAGNSHNSFQKRFARVSDNCAVDHVSSIQALVHIFNTLTSSCPMHACFWIGDRNEPRRFN